MLGNGTVVYSVEKSSGSSWAVILNWHYWGNCLGGLSQGNVPENVWRRNCLPREYPGNVRGQYPGAGEGTNCTSGEICGINCPGNVCGKL